MFSQNENNGIGVEILTRRKEEELLWGQYTLHRDTAAFNNILEFYTPSIKMLVSTFYARRYHNRIEYDDLYQSAKLALIEAIHRFHPEVNDNFLSFALPNIRGKLIDCISDSSELAAQQAARRRLYKERMRSIATPVDGNINDKLEKMIDVAMKLAFGFLLENSELWNEDLHRGKHDIYESVELLQIRHRLLDTIIHLSEKEQNVIKWHYFEDQNFIEISKKLNLTKGRVSQIHANALNKIRAMFEKKKKYTTAV